MTFYFTWCVFPRREDKSITRHISHYSSSCESQRLVKNRKNRHSILEGDKLLAYKADLNVTDYASMTNTVFNKWAAKNLLNDPNFLKAPDFREARRRRSPENLD